MTKNIEIWLSGLKKRGRTGEGMKGRIIKKEMVIKVGKEIERKFLVRGEFRHLAVKHINIIQRYLIIDRDKNVRLRISDKKAYLTIKGRSADKSISRNEWEIPVPVSVAKEMMEICLPGKIEKTRFLVPSGRHVFEVDVFHNRNEGLIIAELELSSESEEFEKPDWLGEEVTGRAEYYNVNLIK